MAASRARVQPRTPPASKTTVTGEMLAEHELINRFLRPKVAGMPLDGGSFIHEADAYSAAPVDLIRGLAHAPGTDRGDGKGKAWFFFSPARCYQSTRGGGSTGKRRRKVAGKEFWHSETGKKDVKDADGRTVGYLRMLSYGSNKKSSPEAAKSFTRLGWCMAELRLEQQDGANQLVLCKVYKSPRTVEASSSTAASSAGQEAPSPIELLDNDPICQSEAAILKKDDAAVAEGEARHGEKAATVFTGVMKFGGSSVASAERMRKVADLILSFPGWPVVVLSAMGKTTNNLLLAGEKAVSCGIQKASEIPELTVIKELHLRTIDELGSDRSIVSGLLEDLEKLLNCIAMLKELTPRTRDHLVSFGECMSTRIFSAYLNKRGGRKARQYDAFDIGFITTDDFTNADILKETYPGVAKRLQGDWIDDPAIPIVTGFLGKGWKSGVVTTLGRGGSDLTATTTGKALGLRDIQVWKAVDGVLTCDPNICANAIPVPYLTFDETDELAYSGARVLHPQSILLAKEGGITVRVKNSCNPLAPGTMITKTRYMSKSKLTSIVLKSNIAMLDIQSKRMPCQCDFQAQVSSILKDLRISVDCMVTRGGNISLTLDPSRLWSRELIQEELDNVVEELKRIADVKHLRQHKSVISLIGNVELSSLILAKAFNALGRIGVEVQMIPPGASKVMNVSLVVHDSDAKKSVQALHSAFLKDGFFSQVEGKDLGKNGSPNPVNSSAAASSSSKRKVPEDHPEVRPAVRRQTDEEDNIPHADEVKRAASSDVLDSSAASKMYTPGGEPAVPSCAERAKTKKDPAPCSVPRQTDEEEDIQRDDPTPMPDDLDVLASSEEMGSRVQGGEPAMPRSAPGTVPEEDAGTCPWTDHELMVLLDNISSAAPCVDHPEDPSSVRQERTDTDGGLLEEIKGWLISDDNPKPVGVDDGGALAGLYFSPSILEVQDEQQGLAEAGSGLHTREALLCPAPAPASVSCESGLHLTEECQTEGCGLCMAKFMEQSREQSLRLRM